MFSEIITPRFSDTDALGHINNTKVAVWFEGGREGIFRFFTPDLDPKNWQLIIAKVEISYHAQLFYGQAIEMKTYIKRIGGASFEVYQELWQHNERCVSGIATMVNFCYATQSSKKMTEEIRQKLAEHMLERSSVEH